MADLLLLVAGCFYYCMMLLDVLALLYSASVYTTYFRGRRTYTYTDLVIGQVLQMAILDFSDSLVHMSLNSRHTMGILL